MENSNSLLIERMVREMQIRNYSEKTIVSYSASMSKLQNFFQVPIDKITVEQFKNFLHHRITIDKVSVSTTNQSISAFKIIQADVLGRTWEPIRVKRPRRNQKLPNVVTVGEIAQMISQCRNIKHKTLLALAYSSGLRLNEIRTLKPAQIDSKAMQIQVKMGKGRKDRYTILSQKALEMLRTYYRLERPVNYLFEANGKRGKCLAPGTLNHIAKMAASKAGIKKEFSFHTLRHCFATHLLEKGVSLPLIQQFMGHTSIKTTTIYLHLANINPGSIQSPLDGMNI